MLLFFSVDRQNVAAEHERICDFKAAVAALVHFLGLVGRRVLFKLRWTMEALSAHRALVRVVFSVYGDDVALEVAGVGAAVLAVATLVVAAAFLVRGGVLR